MHEPTVNPEEIVEELRERIASHHNEPEASKRPAPKAKRRILIAAASCAIALLLAVSAWAWLGRGTPSSAKPGIVDGVEQKIANVVSAGLNRLGGVKTGSSLAKAESPAADDERRGKNAAAKEREIVKRSTKPAAAPREAVVGRPSRVLDLPAIAPVPYAIDSPAGTVNEPISDAASATSQTGYVDMVISESGEAVYSAADRNVQPPVFIRPQLAKQPAATAQTGYFDMVVSETGDVELVKLFSPAHSFHDRMLVAAAKAWKFRPAMRDGKPVSYRIRVSIILPGIS
jgi:hypothetical protein